jgi:hypothetical protein
MSPKKEDDRPQAEPIAAPPGEQGPMRDLEKTDVSPEQAKRVKGGYWTTASYLIWRGGW